MEWREEGKKGGVCTVCASQEGPREKNHILNQIKMFLQVRAAVNQINNHMYR